MTVYIAGPITGDPNYKANFAAVEKKLTEQGHIVMNPAVLPEGLPYEAYFPVCYAMIDACEAVFMLFGWQNSGGAKRERKYAKRAGKIVIEGGMT